jgi:nucleotide sugar dehydrogenase
LDSATKDIATNLEAGTLVVYETTLPVGTTRTRWKPALEAGSGLVEGADFHVAFSPERVLTGRVFEDLRKYPKLIGGLSDQGSEAVRAFYERTLDFDERPDLERENGVWDLGSAEAAEMSKLAETTYRDVNIGLANQFAVLAETAGIDVLAVIEASNSQPYSHIHRPGISVGGHCIPVYPRLYLWNDPSATVVRAAREANTEMPRYAVDLLEGVYGELAGARVVVFGIAYRGRVKESAFSGVFPTVGELEARGAEVRVHDPLYRDDEIRELGFEPYALGDAADAIIVQTDHPEYALLGADDVPGTRAVVDGRRILDPDRWIGTTLQFIGRPSVEGSARP